MPDDPEHKDYPYLTSPELWQKLKPLARQNRHEPTRAENTLRQQLRNRQVANAKFRRQHTIERFIMDFYCAESGLIVEVDGPVHDYTPEEDAIRQEFLESQGLQVLRVKNEDVLRNLDAILEYITGAITKPDS